ncbi:hypothetical protein [Fodinicola feengrottensis]|uniref:hypothetical protein n=1 Tax=Fodinicola feengrottensis TaxID=435914 RepID=UPI0013D2530E|nr:hypothetical protein [Fodinicola feengrottensis]
MGVVVAASDFSRFAICATGGSMPSFSAAFGANRFAAVEPGGMVSSTFAKSCWLIAACNWPARRALRQPLPPSVSAEAEPVAATITAPAAMPATATAAAPAYQRLGRRCDFICPPEGNYWLKRPRRRQVGISGVRNFVSRCGAW